MEVAGMIYRHFMNLEKEEAAAAEVGSTADPAGAETDPDAASAPELLEGSGAGFMGGEPGHDRAGTEERREPKRFSEFEGGSRGSRTDKPPVPLDKLKEERKKREQFEQVKKEFDENERRIAEVRQESKGRLRIIFEALGVKRKVESEEISGFLEIRKNLHPKLMAAGRQVLSGNENEQEWKEFETNYHETMIAIKSRLQEDGIRSKEAKFSNVFVGLANVSKNYRDFISKQFLTDGKLTVKGFAKGMATAAAIGITVTTLIASSLPALGIVAVGSAGATVGAATWRAFSSVGAGYALKKRMEMGFVEKKEKEVQADVQKIIEAKKQKTDEDWKAFIAEKEGLKSITGEEQAFANADAKHKWLALGLAIGTFAAGTIASYYAADIRASAKGLFGQAWDKVTHSYGGGKTGFYEPSHSPITDAGVPKGPSHVPETTGKGAVIPEKIPGKTGISEALEMKKNHSSMGTLRRFALSKFDMITADGHYNPNDALVNDYYQNMKFHHKLPSGLENFDDVRSMPKNVQQEFFKYCDGRMNDYYHGLKRTIIENMRHDPKYYKSLSSEMKQLANSVNNYGNYRNLPPGLKKVVFADREAANWLFDKHHSFENVPKLKAGQLLNVTQDTNGKIFLGDASGIKAGHLHDVPRAGGAGQAVAEASAPRGAGRAAAETYSGRGSAASEPTNFRPTRSPGELAAQAKLDHNQWIKENILHPEYGKAAALEGSMMDMKINYEAVNSIAKGALGNPFLPSEKMSVIAEVIKFHVPGVFPEGSETLTYAEQQARTKGVQFLQSLIKKFPYNPGESYRDYLSKIPLEQIHDLRKQFNL